MEWYISQFFFVLPHLLKFFICLVIKTDYMQNRMNDKYFEFSFWGMIVFTSLWEYLWFTQDYLSSNLVIRDISKILEIMKWEYIGSIVNRSILIIENLNLAIRKKCYIEYSLLLYIYSLSNMTKNLRYPNFVDSEWFGMIDELKWKHRNN